MRLRDMSVNVEVESGLGQGEDSAFNGRVHGDLAAESTGVRKTRGQIEEVLLAITSRVQTCKGRVVNDDMTRGTSERLLAGALEFHAVGVRGLQHGNSRRRIDRFTCSVSKDKFKFD